MKKLLYLFLALIFIFSCSGDSDNSTADDGNNTINPFIGEWTGSYEEVISQSPGLDVGTWQGTVDTQNNFIGVETNVTDGVSTDYSGFVPPNGDASIVIGTSGTSTVFTGVFYGNEASGIFVSNSSTPPNYGTWKGTKTIPDNDFVFSEFVGTWSLLTQTTNGVDLFLSECELNSTVVVSPTVLLINEYSASQTCGFDTCRIYSLETWDISYGAGSSATITQTKDTNFCNGEVDGTDTSLELDVNFEVSGEVLTVSYDLPQGDGSVSLIEKTYQRI
jgi:hypothetical protein